MFGVKLGSSNFLKIFLDTADTHGRLLVGAWCAGNGVDIMHAGNLDYMSDVRLIALQWRIYSRCCGGYGVSAFDAPTFRVVYSGEYHAIKMISAILAQRRL